MRQRLGILFGFIYVFLPSNLWAVDCIRSDPRSVYNEASQIFIGKSAARETILLNEELQGSIPIGDRDCYKFTFEVLKTFKGPKTSAAAVFTECSDGTRFRTGNTYLVVAKSSADLPNHLTLPFCNKTLTVEDASEEIKYLESLPNDGSGQKIVK